MDYAIQFTGKEQAALVKQVRPAAPDKGHILGTSLFSLISPGTELEGGFLREHDQAVETGYATVFRVDQVGEAAGNFRAGDIVFCSRSHQSYQHLPANEAISIPAELDPALAVLSRLMNIGMTALMTTQAKPGDHVFITGAGPVGLLAALIFQRCGYKVMLSDPNEARLESARAAGIMYTSPSIPAHDSPWVGQTALVLECSGHETATIDALKLIRKGSEIVLSGVPWKRNTEHYLHELLSLVFHKYAILRSGWEWELPITPQDFRPYSFYGNIQTAMDWLSDGTAQLAPLIRKVSPHHVQQVYEELAQRSIHDLFVMFDWKKEVDPQ
ncbi:zinc-dependent alcohol dehydrogenase [Paenibacillus sp. GXUN7292]|uniref:zinc-dependent alcohol dehydrogenase n=1 Tax=Paenibacillus sp. GXUN7292 TaxID=3422499 RepID=UPI003D7E06CC